MHFSKTIAIYYDPKAYEVTTSLQLEPHGLCLNSEIFVSEPSEP
jgi:hypothetical protein